MQTIGIYCSASILIKPIFEQEASKLGEWIGKCGKTLINGGSNQGLMEVFSKAVKKNGGKCIGVIPANFSERGWYSNQTDEKIIVRNLSERKEIIKKRSDILIVFPGGIGTMDEFFDAWSSYTLGFHDKKIILVNIDSFFTSLLQQIEIFKKEKFLHEFLPNPLLIVNSVAQCIERIEMMEKDGTSEHISDQTDKSGVEFQIR